eukprot:5425366-Pyramimonas_sp.AAC.1
MDGRLKENAATTRLGVDCRGLVDPQVAVALHHEAPAHRASLDVTDEHKDTDGSGESRARTKLFLVFDVCSCSFEIFVIPRHRREIKTKTIHDIAKTPRAV